MPLTLADFLPQPLIEKTYTWDDSVNVLLSGGNEIQVHLGENRDAKYVGYMCPHCNQGSTLAYGECSHCEGTLTPDTFEGAETLFPNVEVKIEDANRLAYILLHRSWICTSCSSYNINYPRGTEKADDLDCLNCRDSYEEGVDILLEDGDIEMSESDAIQSFKENILDIIYDHAESLGNQDIPQDKIDTYDGPETYSDEYSYFESNHDKLSIMSSLFSSLQRNNIKVFGTVFGTAGFGFLANYGFIENIDKHVSIEGHSWERIIPIEEYKKQSGSGWEEKTNKFQYDDFDITSRSMREADWDSYQVQTGTRTVTDYANCTSYSTPAQVCTTPSEQCNYTTVNGVTVRSGCYTPPQSCYTPSPSCMSHGTKQEPVYDTRYHEHAYIHYTYMDWENIDKITTSGNDKRPYWEDDIRYDLDRDDVREGKRIENYTVKVLVNDNNYQDVNLSGDDWNNTEVGGSCVIQKPRWIPINKNDVIQIGKGCDF